MAMLPFQAAVLCALVQYSRSIDPRFPPYFKFGAGTAAYQVEGGWNADGKGESMWDTHLHEYPGDIKGNATGDVAADSYHLWREDVKIAAKLGLQYYKFSINWPRVLPTGFTNKINPAGVKYYSDLIDALLAEGIEPIVTLYHWELPTTILRLGAWTNPLIVKWFGDFSRVIYSLYADRVKTWVTINEPIVMCDFYYNTGFYPTRLKDPDLAPFLCNRHVMLAHAKAYRIFEQEFRPKHEGRISIANNLLWIEPATPDDEELARLGREHQWGRYCHPIFSKEGGWPLSIEKLMLEVSLKQGYKESRLPPFTEEEKAFVKGTADFFGMNHYTTNMIRSARPGDKPGIWFTTGSPELNAILESPPEATFGATPILPVYPKGIRKQLSWLKQHYGDIDIIITENGYASTGHQLNDFERADFIKNYLEQVLLAIKVDNVRVTGYIVWSLIDSFEWLDGYNTKFGLYEVDYDHPNRTRTPRVSADYYACVIANRSLDVPDSCYNKKSVARRKGERNGGHIEKDKFVLRVNVIVFILSFVYKTGY
ncbi:myrosinase 1 isoform X1 [Bicyclus anynana]|uniref:Myrosinase 1 isoform X1 n=1 Tax=Bicyclus anynana TaxID=110368 RepID=A0ABM3LWC9_BICAN|nr:myrosinase 1 isoform X1 [Bicyclus anynana]